MRIIENLRLRRELRKYEIKEAKKKKNRRKKSFRGLVWIGILGGAYYFLRQSEMTQIESALSLFGILLLWMFSEATITSRNLRGEIDGIQKSQNHRDIKIASEVSEKVSKLKEEISQIIQKDEDGYDVKVWNVGGATSFVLGKKSERNHVDIDLGRAAYASLISRTHGILNKIDSGWYYEDLGSANGSGIERREDGRKVKIIDGKPVKLSSGDILHIANTKILVR